MSHKGIRCIVMSYIRVCGLQLVGLSARNEDVGWDLFRDMGQF